MKKAPVYEITYTNGIRMISDDMGWWAVAKDVCDSLGYSDYDKALSEYVEDEDKDRAVIKDDDGDLEKVSVINAWAIQLLSRKRQSLKEK